MQPFVKNYYRNLTTEQKLWIDCAVLLELQSDILSVTGKCDPIDGPAIETMRNGMAAGFGDDTSLIELRIGNTNEDKVTLISDALSALKDIDELKATNPAFQKCSEFVPFLTELAHLKAEMQPTQTWLAKIGKTLGTQEKINIER